MWKFHLVIFFFVSKTSAIRPITVDCLDVLDQNIAENVRPRQIIFFINNIEEVDFSEISIIMKKLTKQIPFSVIEFKTFQMSSVFWTSLKSNSLNIILHNSGKDLVSESFQDLLDFIILDSHDKLKILLILGSKSSKPYYFFQNLFKFIWQRKILNFSTLEMYEGNETIYPSDCLIRYHNPFYRNFVKRYVKKDTDIFPDKLKNVNAYNFKLIIDNATNSLKIKKNKDGIISEVNDVGVATSVSILLTMNFYLQTNTVGSNMTYGEIEKAVCQKLDNNEENMLANPKHFCINTSTLTRIILDDDCVKYIAVVPVISNMNVNVSTHILMRLVLTPLVVIVFVVVLKMFTIQRENLKILSILQVFFSVTVHTKPLKNINRIIFVTVVIIAMDYALDFYSNFLSLQLFEEQNKFDTFESIDRTGFNLYTYKTNFDFLFWKNDKYVKNLKRKTIKVEDIRLCIKNVLERNDRICILPEELAEFLIKKQSPTRYSLHEYKIAPPVFICLRKAWIFENFSPYSEKFLKILRKFQESGISQLLGNGDEDIKESSLHFNKFSTAGLLVRQLSAILLSGNLLSIVTFFVEVIYKKIYICIISVN